MFNSNSCVTCKDSITDPVCRDCYIKQTQVLLNDLKIHPIIKDFITNKLKDIFHLETLNDSECILCKNDTVTVCHYCFSVSLIRVLRELNFTEDLIEHFEYNPLYEENYLENEIVHYKFNRKYNSFAAKN